MIKRSRFKLWQAARRPTTSVISCLRNTGTAEGCRHTPKHFGHEKLVGAHAWQMLGNGPDNSVSSGFKGAGDCVFAGGDHETMLWNLEREKTVKFVGANAIKDYAAVTGYDPKAPLDAHGDNPTDLGTNTRTALSYRRKTGLIDAAGKRHKIGAYVALELGNMEQLLEALYLFGVVGIGIKFPDSAMDQFNAGKPWSVVAGPAPTEGHYIPLVAYRTNLECVTWGRVQQMTPQFYKTYCDEALGDPVTGDAEEREVPGRPSTSPSSRRT